MTYPQNNTQVISQRLNKAPLLLDDQFEQAKRVFSQAKTIIKKKPLLAKSYIDRMEMLRPMPRTMHLITQRDTGSAQVKALTRLINHIPTNAVIREGLA